MNFREITEQIWVIGDGERLFGRGAGEGVDGGEQDGDHNDNQQGVRGAGERRESVDAGSLPRGLLGGGRHAAAREPVARGRHGPDRLPALPFPAAALLPAED